MENRFVIEKARCRFARVPVRPPAGDSTNCFHTLELPVVDLIDKQGAEGVGFGYTIGYGGSAIVEILREELLPRVIGQDARYISHIHQHLKKSINILSEGIVGLNALAAIDIALWDLAGVRAKVSTSLLLGGASNAVPVYNTDVGWLSHPLPELVSLCRRAVLHGPFRAVKLKVGSENAEEDIERVAKVREAVGPRVQIMIDANTAWTLDEAVACLSRLEPYDLTWVEEPIALSHVQSYQNLKRHTRIPIALGESLVSPGHFYEFVRQGAVDILQPDVTRLGGISTTLEVCHLAGAAGLKVSPHVSPDLSIVIAAAITNSMFIEFIPQMNPVLKSRLEMREGKAFISELPGNGIVFDWEAFEKYEVYRNH